MVEKKAHKKRVAPYAPFKTFMSSLDTLSHGVPNIIDRTLWPTYSGVIQSQVLGSYRFFGLISDAGHPTEMLKKLVEDPDSRKENLKGLLKKNYPELMALDLTKATPASFHKVMAGYGLTGETLKKASTFFLQAARYSDLPLSQYILLRSRTTSTGRKRRTLKPKARRSASGANDTFDNENSTAAVGPTKAVALANGITLTLTTSDDTFKMISDDRRFVLEMLDKLEEYETKKTSSNKPSEAGKKGGAK